MGRRFDGRPDLIRSKVFTSSQSNLYETCFSWMLRQVFYCLFQKSYDSGSEARSGIFLLSLWEETEYTDVNRININLHTLR